MQWKQRILTIVFFLAAFAIFSQTAFSQGRRPPQPKLGFSASLSGGQNAWSIPFWVSNNLIIAPSLAFNKTDGGNTMIAPGVAIRSHMKAGRIRTFFGGLVSISSVSPPVGNSLTFITVGGLFGATYFFHPMFCMSIENQLLVDLENTNAATPMQIYSNAVLRATVYIK